MLLFFCYHSIHWKFANLLRRRVRMATSILKFPRMVKHWPSSELDSRRSTRLRCPEERNTLSSPIIEVKQGLAWTPDGRALVFTNGNGLWKISLRGGDPERLQVGQNGVEPSIRGSRLAYVQRISAFNIWKRRLHSSGSAESPDKLLPSTRMQSGPQFSPDGTRIAFESTRSGTNEIWACQSDGSRLMQLTNFSPSEAGTPRWSPDGNR